MLKLDVRYKETLTYNLSLTGTRDPSQATARMLIKINDDFSISIPSKNDGSELIFKIPALQKIIKINDKEIVKYWIELIVEDYYLIALDSEIELLNPPEASISKVTQLKREVKEEIKPIQIKQKQVFKEKTDFQKSFDVMLQLKNAVVSNKK